MKWNVQSFLPHDVLPENENNLKKFTLGAKKSIYPGSSNELVCHFNFTSNEKKFDWKEILFRRIQVSLKFLLTKLQLTQA